MGPAAGCGAAARVGILMAGQGAGAEPLRAGTPVPESHCPFSSQHDHRRQDWKLPTHQDPSKVLGLYFGLWLKLSTCLTFFSQVPIFRPFGFSFFAVCPPRIFICQDSFQVPRPEGRSQSGWG